MSANSGELKKGLKVKHLGKTKIVKDWCFVSDGAMHNSDLIVIRFQDGTSTGSKGFTDIEYIKPKSTSKRVKINFESINKGKWKPIDMTKVYEESKKQYEKSLERYKKDKAAEEKRIEKLTCPNCKSKDKKHILKYESNGIMGPGSRSWTTDDYYICQSCGIHFTDLNKKDIQPPSRGLFNF